jgi:hypothetical protein
MKWRELDAKAQLKAAIVAAFVVIAILTLLWPSGGPAPRRLPPSSVPQAPKGMPRGQRQHYGALRLRIGSQYLAVESPGGCGGGAAVIRLAGQGA